MRNRPDLILKLEKLKSGDKLKCLNSKYKFIKKGEIVTFARRASLTLLRFEIKEYPMIYEIDDFKIIEGEEDG